MNLQETTWVITGASAGIGEALGWAAARAGAKQIYLVARREERLEALAAELEQKFNSLSCCPVVADLTSPEERITLAEKVFSAGPVDVWVNNAGMGSNGCFDQLTTQSVLDLVRLNVEALAHLTSLAAQKMCLRKSRSAILQVGSVAGLMPVPTMGLYAATKAFVVSLTDSLVAELASTQVSVHSLNPGPVKTRFLDVANERGAVERSHVVVMQSANAVAESAIRGLKLNLTHIYPWLAWPFPLLAWAVPRWVWRITGALVARFARRRPV